MRQSPGYVWVVKDDLSELVMSPALQKVIGLSGYPKEGHQFFGAHNEKALSMAMIQAKANGIARLEIDLLPDDDRVDSFLSFSVFCNYEDENKYYYAQGLDLTAFHERERAAAEAVRKLESKLESSTRDLALARDRAMAANRAKSGFLANMSHELRTPLNAVIGYSEILQEDVAGNEQQEADLQKIHNAGKHLLSLINDILDLSKIEAGKMGLNLEYFTIDGMLTEVIDTIRPLAQKNSTELTVNHQSELGVMLSDVTKVRQILFNLLSNAIKFTENGTVSIDVKREKDEEREYVVFLVEDNGLGMSKDDQKRIFEEFVQIENEASKKWGGTGLGLVICQRFTQMMGGELEMESEPGKGTKFMVRIPINTAKLRFQDSPDGFSVGPKVDPRLVRFAGNTKDVERRTTISRVLVIDDDPAVRDLMERYLSREGFDVKAVAGGQEGMKVIPEFKPDVITLDVLMPVMDGWSVLSELKKNPLMADIPVIMLSMMDELDMSFALGAADYMIKPIQKDVLVATVLKHLRDNNEGRVLVVDDKAENRSIISRTLGTQGINMLEAGNGYEALAVMESTVPDLILLDLMMPEMDGFRFSEEVKKRDEWKEIPIIVLTARELTPEDMKRLSGNVEKVYERKGIDFESFLFDIQSIVSRQVRGIK